METGNFTCSICERNCETDKHGKHEHTDGPACDDCHFGEDSEESGA